MNKWQKDLKELFKIYIKQDKDLINKLINYMDKSKCIK